DVEGAVVALEVDATGRSGVGRRPFVAAAGDREREGAVAGRLGGAPVDGDGTLGDRALDVVAERATNAPLDRAAGDLGGVGGLGSDQCRGGQDQTGDGAERS